jgi:hypothetical protein
MAAEALSGVIYPPPDIRAIADKTAEFAARNGPEFETRIMNTNAGNAKFRFLSESDPFRAYYDMRVREFREGILKEKEAPKPEEVPAAAEAAAPAASENGDAADAHGAGAGADDDAMGSEPAQVRCATRVHCNVMQMVLRLQPASLSASAPLRACVATAAVTAVDRCVGRVRAPPSPKLQWRTRLRERRVGSIARRSLRRSSSARRTRTTLRPLTCRLLASVCACVRACACV